MSTILSNLEKDHAEWRNEALRLRTALELIARKKKMDAVAAVSMRAIAVSALSSHHQQEE